LVDEIWCLGPSGTSFIDTLKTQTDNIHTFNSEQPKSTNYKLPSEGFMIGTPTTSLTFDLRNNSQKTEKNLSGGKSEEPFNTTKIPKSFYSFCQSWYPGHYFK